MKGTKKANAGKERQSRADYRRLLAAVLFVAAACAATFFATRGYYGGKTTVEYVERPAEKEKIIEVPVETKTVVTGEIMQGRLNDIGELATEEYAYTEVGTFDSKMSVQLFGHEVNVPGTQSKFIYSYDGTIKAGIDFTKITVVRSDERKQFTVTLPDAEILSSELDADSFELYDEKNNIFNPISVKDVNDTNRTLKQHAEQKAIDRGLLTRANANARRMIESLLRSSYDLGEYRITVVTGK